MAKAKRATKSSATAAEAAKAALEIARLIRRNVEAERAGRLSYESYFERQVAYWKKADELGLREAVLDLLWSGDLG